MANDTKTYSQEDLEQLLDAVYAIAKWQAYDNITEDSAVWEFIYDLMTEAAYLDPDRYEKAQQDGVREALDAGADKDEVLEAGYELPPELQEEPKHA